MSLAADRLTQVFTFLREFTSLQNPVSRDLSGYPFVVSLAEAPSSPFISIPIRQGTTAEDDFVLQVRRPRLTSPRKPDDILAEWVIVSQDPDKQPDRREAINRTSDESTVTEKFNGSPERIVAWELWLRAWKEWADAERPNRIADKFFQRVYGMRALLERESESFELVIGDGILACREAGISHPIISQRVVLNFDPAIPEFTIRVSDSESELNMALLWELPEKVTDEIARCGREFAEQGLSPADPEGLKPFLNRVKMVVSFGEYYESPPSNPPRCFIYSSPVLFLRRRSGGFNAAIQRIIDAIPRLDEQEQLPPALIQVCGISNPNLGIKGEDSGEYSDSNYGNERSDILFSKPANREQVQIVDRLNRHGTVIVQGPPGTGKSYTIGNIIGHLLAKGEKILVTAHTTKALQVVRAQVVDELRSLCVAVLGDDTTANAELEKAVNSILEHLDNDPKQLEREANCLNEEREKLLKEIKEARALSLLVRNNEFREIAIGGMTLSPSEAARTVKCGIGLNDWLPAPIAELERPPIEEADIHRLYSTNDEIGAEEEAELQLANPALGDLPEPQKYRSFVDLLDQASRTDRTTGSRFWKRNFQDADGDTLDAASKLAEFIPKLLDSQPWYFHVAAEAMTSVELRTKWVNTAETIKRVTAEAHEFSSIAADHGPELNGLPDLGDEELATHLSEIETHVREKGKISSFTLLFKPMWRTLIQASSVNGKKPVKADEFAALGKLVQIRESRRLLVLRWERTMVQLGAHTSDQLGEAPEQILIHYASEIEKLVSWQKSFLDPLLSHLQSAGFDWETFLDSVPQQFATNGHLWRLKLAICDALPTVLLARINALNLKVAKEQMENATRALRSICDNPVCSRVSQTLMAAVVNRDSGTYADAYEVLRDLERKRSILELRNQLLAKLKEFAPAWAELMRARRPPHNSGNAPGDIRAAWTWLRLTQELEARAAQAPENIDRLIEGMTGRLFELTSTISSKLAWSQQIRRLEKNQQARMALTGWQQTIQRLGRGTGPHAAARRQSAREEMRNAKEAVPVWVMPLKKVLENFDPVTTRFNTIIIDEASQCDVMGLVPLFMADKIIVVGDHEQVSPDAVGMKQDDVERIVQLYLDDIPQKHLYDGKASIYQFAQRAFSGMIMLREHFRCDSQIINYSNRLAYGGKIVPLRDTSRIATKPPVVPIKVDGVCVDKRNQREAEMIAALIEACLERQEYREQGGMPVTYGVISLMGTEQADLIRNILTQHLSSALARIERHRIICGNPAQFQGDERDVIFLSMVDSPSGGGPITLRRDDRFKKRFNVAASRARNQEWLVYSLDPNIDLQPEDLRRGLIEHFIDPDAMEERIQDAERKADSEFERRVLRRLIGENYVVHPQWKVGKYRIDLVIEGERSRLAVELDGDRYHPPEKLAEDMERQAMLERAGWRFVRIRGSRFFRDEEAALKPLYEKLDQIDIRPIAQNISKEFEQDSAVREIHARAVEILAAWNNPTSGLDCEGEAAHRVDIPSVPIPAQSPKPESPRHVAPQQRQESTLVLTSDQPSPRINRDVPVLESLRQKEIEVSANIPLKGPFTITRFTRHTGRPLPEIRTLAWRAAQWAEDDDPMPRPKAEALARLLCIKLA